MKRIITLLFSIIFLITGAGAAYSQCPAGWGHRCEVLSITLPGVGTCNYQVCYCYHYTGGRLDSVQILSISPQSPCMLSANAIQELGREIGRIYGGPCNAIDKYKYDLVVTSSYCVYHDANPAPFGTYHACGAGTCVITYEIECDYGAYYVRFKSKTGNLIPCPPPQGTMPCTDLYSPCAP